MQGAVDSSLFIFISDALSQLRENAHLETCFPVLSAGHSRCNVNYCVNALESCRKVIGSDVFDFYSLERRGVPERVTEIGKLLPSRSTVLC
jgi:hypothetical protein